MNKYPKSLLASAVLAASAGLSMLAVSTSAEARQVEEELQDEALIFPYYTVRDGWTTLANVTNTSPHTIIAKVRYRESYNSRDVLDFNVVLSPFDVWTGWVSEGPNGPRLNTRDSSCTTPIFETAPNGSKYADMSNLGYQQDGGPTGIDRAREGHFEFITMGQFYPGAEDEKWDCSGSASPAGDADIPPAWNGSCNQPPSGEWTPNDTPNTISWSSGDVKYPTAYYAKHVDGKPRNCAMVDSRFESTSPFNKPAAGDTDVDGDPLAEWDNRLNRDYWPSEWNEADDPLKGNFGLVNVGQGTAAGGIPVAKGMHCDYEETDLITAQEYPFFLEPSLYSACDYDFQPACEPSPPFFENCGEGPPEEDDGGNWDWNPIISQDLDVAGLNNEWSFNANTGAATDWVVTFPTKEFHVDISETDLYAGVNPIRLERFCNFDVDYVNKWNCNIWNGWVGMPGESGAKDSFEEAFVAAGGLYLTADSAFEEVFDGQSCDTVVYNLWDREETGVEGSGTSISPAPPQPTDSLCYETNVLSFQDDSVLGSDLAIEVDTSILPSGAAAGWLKLQVSENCSFDFWGFRDDDYCEDDELPAIGFAFKQRDFGDPTRNFGVLMEYGYDD